MPPCQGGCREFEPRLPLHLKNKKNGSPVEGLFLLPIYERRGRTRDKEKLTLFVAPSICSCRIRRMIFFSTENVTFSHLFLLANRHSEPRLPLHFKNKKNRSPLEGLFYCILYNNFIVK